jgi:dTDP-glucose pyrophosphorylase
MSDVHRRTTAIITMAGAGRRFRDAGHNVAKFRVNVRGRTLFAWSMESLRSFIDGGARFVFVSRVEDVAREFIFNEARAFGVASLEVVELDHLTDGQATTALLGGQALSSIDGPVFIYNIDTFVEPAYLPMSATRGEGWVPCFLAMGEGWSFARVDPSDRILELREKQRVAPWATIGLYWFASFAVYSAAYKTYYADAANLERGERYVAPLYNQLIAEGRPVYMHRVPTTAVHGLGTPMEVETFRAKA